MTIEFFTGFEGCGQDADVRVFFDSLNSLDTSVDYNASNGYNSSKCLFADIREVELHKNVSTAGKTFAIGWHVKGVGTWDTITNDEHRSLAWFVGPDIRILNTSTGIKVYRTTTLIASCTTVISSTITHIQIKVFSDASAGTVEIKVNGTTVLSETGLNTGGSDITKIVWGTSYTNDVYFDNMYISNDFEGEIYSVMLSPSADGTVAFTPSTGTDNYAMVDDAAQDGDTTYVESDTVSTQDLYDYDDLDSGLIPVAVSVVTVARKEGTGGRSLQARAKQDATEYDVGSSAGLGTTYPDGPLNQAMVTLLATAPDSSAWTRTILNAMEFGFEVRA